MRLARARPALAVHPPPPVPLMSAKPTAAADLKRRQQPITDVLYGPDHPSKAAKGGKKAPPQMERAAVAERQGKDPVTHKPLAEYYLDPITRQKLGTLKWRLQRKGGTK